MTSPSAVGANRSFYVRRVKRSLDLALSVPALIALAPVLALIALLVRARLGRPVLFRQERPGLDGKIFVLFKFRTMTDARDPDGNLLPDANRLTHLGRFLRSTSLDELPELFNVVRGEMSLVGPRPLLKSYYPYFTDAERVRFRTRPGITGLAQISGRNQLPWDSRLAADVEYVESCSLALDLKILLQTGWRVLTRHGLEVVPGATMLNFDEERRRHSADGLDEIT